MAHSNMDPEGVSKTGFFLEAAGAHTQIMQIATAADGKASEGAAALPSVVDFGGCWVEELWRKSG